MKRQCVIFSGLPAEVERAVNKWFESNSIADIHSVSYAAAYPPAVENRGLLAPTEPRLTVSAMVLFEPKEQN